MVFLTDALHFCGFFSMAGPQEFWFQLLDPPKKALLDTHYN